MCSVHLRSFTLLNLSENDAAGSQSGTTTSRNARDGQCSLAPAREIGQECVPNPSGGGRLDLLNHLVKSFQLYKKSTGWMQTVRNREYNDTVRSAR